MALNEKAIGLHLPLPLYYKMKAHVLRRRLVVLNFKVDLFTPKLN